MSDRPILQLIERPTGGGWVLEDKVWDEETGVARYEYSRRGSQNRWELYLPEPTHPSHVGWDKLLANWRQTPQ